jgi:hypothetical protein
MVRVFRLIGSPGERAMRHVFAAQLDRERRNVERGDDLGTIGTDQARPRSRD